MRKHNASAEEALLLDIEHLLGMNLAGQANATQRSKLPSQLIEAHRTAVDMTAEQQLQLRWMAESAKALDDKKTRKAAEKVLRDVNPNA